MSAAPFTWGGFNVYSATSLVLTLGLCCHWCFECTLVASHLHIVLLLPLPIVGIAAGGITFDFLYRMASLLEEGQTTSGMGT